MKTSISFLFIKKYLSVIIEWKRDERKNENLKKENMALKLGKIRETWSWWGVKNKIKWIVKIKN